MSATELKSTRDAFGQALLELAEKSSKLWVLSADLTDSMRVTSFADKYKDRHVQCGVAEQNMVGIAAGLAANGKVPFVTSFAAFSPGRNWDQLRVSVCLSNLPVKVVSGATGFGNSKDGASHQALEDIAITRVLPNLKVVTPLDFNQTKQAVLSIFKDPGPVYMRIGHEKVPNITKSDQEFVIGKADLLKEGEEITVISAGAIMHQVLEAIKSSRVKADVINLSTIKPIDKEAILTSLEKTRKVMTIEDHQVAGGLGSAVAEVIAQSGKRVKMKILGVPDTFSRSARNIDDLYKLFKLDSKSLEEEIKEFIRE